MRWIMLIVAFVSVLTIEELPAPPNPGRKQPRMIRDKINPAMKEYWSGFV